MNSKLNDAASAFGVLLPITLIAAGIMVYVSASQTCADSCGNLQSAYRRDKCYCDGKLLHEGPARGAPAP